MPKHTTPTALLLVVAAACADSPLSTTPEDLLILATVVAVPDISGTWAYAEESILVLRPGDDVIRMRCSSPAGVLTIVQTGATFSGTLTHPAGTCVTLEGVSVPTPWPLPYEATLSGTITGRALHIDQFDAPPAPPVHCPKSGTIRLENGTPIELRTSGRCDLSDVPFRPAIATNSGIAVR